MPSMRKFASQKEIEFRVLPKDGSLPEEESESLTPRLPEEESESPTPGLSDSESPTPGLPESESPTPELPTPVQNNVEDCDQPDKKSWSDPEVIGEVLKWCIQIGVTITVLVFQFRGWPQVSDVYITDNPWDTSRGRETYNCECSLPENLTANTGLNFCYNRSDLEDVTILTYTHNAKAKIAIIVADVEPDQKIYELQARGYVVIQDAYGLQGSIINEYDTLAYELDPSNSEAIYPQPSLQVRIDNLLSSSFELTNFWTLTYLRLYFQYYCNNCSHCGPDQVNDAWIKTISTGKDWWVSCFFQNSSQQTCSQGDHDAFFVKCVGYPKTTVPPNEKIWELLKKIVELQGSLNVSVRGERNESTYMTVESRHLYLNIGEVQSQKVIQLNFVEVIRNSPLWVSLLTSFPTLDEECATMPLMQVCSGTYVCSLFTSYFGVGNGPYQSSCKDMKNQTRCKQIMTMSANGIGESTLDITKEYGDIQSRLNATSWLEVECPEFICKSVHPSFVAWYRSVFDPLNLFLFDWILDEDWAQRGVCTITYRDVYRYVGATPEAEENGTMFFQTECTKMSPSWRNPEDKCWLTGRYHKIKDSPTDDWKQLGEHHPLSVNLRKRFVCSGRKKQGIGPWFIATMGILFGWIGTVQLIWTWFTKKIKHWIIRKKRNLMTSPKD